MSKVKSSCSAPASRAAFAYHLLKKEVQYVDLGPDYFDKLKPEQFRRYLVKRLESLGYDVTLSPKDTAA